MGDDSEWIKLCTEDKCVHKVWKARLSGYEEATKLFNTLDEKSPEFLKYLGIIKKFVVDNNAIAQEKGLEAVLAYVENAHCAGKTVGEVCSGLITKCLYAPRAKTKEKAIEILLMYIEVERQEVVQEELLKGLGHKQPKVVVGCLQALTQAVREFGNKVVPLKPVVKHLQRLLEDRDKTVRDETKQLCIEIYRWIGVALKPQLANLKPVQITELEAEFEKLNGQKARQTRFLRSQQDLKAKMEEQAAQAASGDGTVEDDEDEAVEVDPYDLMDPVAILTKLPKDFFEKIEAKKWQDRKESLEALHKLLESPKLEQGDYHDLVKALRKVVAKDTNVMLVAMGTRCIASLASGLRKKFSPYANACLEAVLEKFREKKVSVVAALREASDAIYLTTTLEAISESCIEALEHKTPSVRSETASFLARVFSRCTPATLPKKMLKMFVVPILKMVVDAQIDVREASFRALGTAMKVVGEKPLLPLLADVDSLKMAKIKESCEQAEVVGKSGKRSGAGGGGAAAAAAPPAKAVPASKPVVRPGAKKKASGDAAEECDSAPPGGPSSRPAGVRPKTAPGKTGVGKKKADAKGKKGAADAKEEIQENYLSDEVVDEVIGGMMTEETVKGLGSANWKERLSSMEKFTEVVKGMSRDEIPAQACVRTIVKKPGLKENNFQVLKLKVELVAYLAKNSKFTTRSVSFCLTDLCDKIGDVKNGAAAKEALSCMSEATSLEHVSQQVVQYAFEQKNPKNQSESLAWLATAIQEFGFKVNVKLMIENIKKALAATNPAVRTSAVTLLGVIYVYMGQTLRMLFESEKAALLQSIDAEFEKVKDQKRPTPVRGLSPGSPSDEAEDEDGDGDDEGGAAGGGGVNIADLIPRTDIIAQITDELLTEMADKNWKVRNEALQKVVAILNEAKFITPNIGALPEALKVRLGDSNKILMAATVSICQTLATAMGPNVRNHVRVIGPGLVSCLGDTKPALRTSTRACLDVWVEQAGLHPFVEAELFSDALKLENPNLRTELLSWLAEKLPNAKKVPTELNMCIPHIFSCLEDRSGDVRKKAHEALVPFMIHTGYDTMFRQAGKLKPSSKDQILGILEKAKVNLPAKPPPKAKAAVAPSKGKVTKQPAKPPTPTEDEDEYDDEPARPSTAPAKTGAGAKGAPAKGKAGAAAKKGAPAAAAAASKKKGNGDEDTSPAMRVSNGKEQRFKDEKSLRVLKWNFTMPRGEFSDQLKQQMEPHLNHTLAEQLFHADFKLHIKALETMTKACDDLPKAVISNSDVILKWVTLRFFDTNTTVLLKTLEFLQTLFAVMSAEDYHLQELEAMAFVPYLINKVGDPKDNMRKNIRIIFRLICKVYPASKMFSYLIEGLKSKNARQRTECLEELGNLIEVYGINVCQPAPAQALKIIAQQISDRDNSVRSTALNTIVTAYHILGETVYKFLGNLSDKDAGMLEERIKRSSKPKEAAPPPPSRASPEERPKAAKAPLQANQPRVAEPRSGLQRPKTMRREFMLDLDDAETTAVEMPYLLQPELDDLNEPINLPETRMRPPSPSMKLLNSSNDARTAIDLVISQVASNDIVTSLQALAQIDGVLKHEEKCAAMTEHIDQFLVVCSLQLRMAYSKHMSSDDPVSKENVVRLYKCLLGSMLALFQCHSLAKCTSRDILKDLIQNLITIMMDSRLTKLEEGPQVVRSVNVMVVKIVEKSDQTNIMSALIKLLHESVGTETTSPKFLELIMKCLWRMVRMLPNIINDLNVAQIIGDIHQFLNAFPSYSWKARPSDMPLRTIKTILHSLAKLQGNKIMSHLDLVNEPTSEVEMYLRKVLKNGLDASTGSGTDATATANNKNQHMNGADVEYRSPGTKKEGSKSTKRISKSTNDLLAEIFKKIGSKENTREGLNDLYDFKARYPEVDLEPFFKKSSQFFQSYIERGLKNIEVERQSKTMKQSQSVPALSASSSSNSVGSTASAGAENDVNPALYMERLKVLRARCGLDNSNLDGSEAPPGGPAAKQPSSSHAAVGATAANYSEQNGSTSSLSSGSSGGAGPPLASGNDEPAAPANVDDLRRRLERIKNASKN